MKTQWHNNWSI